jgi:adenylate cyclase
LTATILVVDDEPDLQALVIQKFRRRVREGELRFLFAQDGVEALEALQAADGVDMILSDINMPRMDGLTFLQSVKDSGSGHTTVIVSAYGDMANIRRAMNNGAFDFVTKPIDFGDLEATIDKTLAHVLALREAVEKRAAAERAQATLSRFFSPNLAERLASDEEALRFGGEWREVATLFTDVTSFTALLHMLPPAQLGMLLNEYIGGMTEIIFAHDGTVAKIVGDALHVLFGAPTEQPDRAARAVRCALEIDAFSENFRARWRARGVAFGATRVGIHAGPAIVGNFGGGQYFNYTAYGDTINTAARLEEANKALGTRVLVSAAVTEQMPEFRGRPAGAMLLRGRSGPLAVFEPLSEARHADPATTAYVAAYDKLRARDPTAVAAFAALVGENKLDSLIGFHLRRLLNGGEGDEIALD